VLGGNRYRYASYLHLPGRDDPGSLQVVAATLPDLPLRTRVLSGRQILHWQDLLTR